MVTRVPIDPKRDRHLLSLLLDYPYLHDGITAEAGLNYLLGRTHNDRRNERWRLSIKAFAWWLKRMGFSSVSGPTVYKYYWTETEEE